MSEGPRGGAPGRTWEDLADHVVGAVAIVLHAGEQELDRGAGVKPLAKLGLPTTFAVEVQGPVPEDLIVRVKDAEPDAPVVSLAVTVTLSVPAVVGVPEIRPELELIDRPAGRPVAL